MIQRAVPHWHPYLSNNEDSRRTNLLTEGDAVITTFSPPNQAYARPCQNPHSQKSDLMDNCGAMSIYGEPCPPCTRRTSLQEAIATCRTQKDLKPLLLEYRKTAQEINDSHDPIMRLPIEIISHIFQFTIPPFTPVDDSTPDSSNVEALKLGAVCSKWRKVAWATPRLWKAITLSLSNVPTSNQIKVVSEWLSRSKLPLSIRLHFNFKSLESVDQFIGFLQLFKHFKANSKRWETLSLIGPNFLLREFTASRGDGAPNLKRLEIAGHDIEDVHFPFEPVLQDKARPKPEKVVTSGIPINMVKISWANVTDVQVHHVTILDCITLLKDAPRLVSCSFIDLQESFDDTLNQLAIQPKVYPGLQTLTLISADGVLDHLVLPALQDLFIRAEGGPLPTDSLIAFFQRSSCALASLQLQGFQCPEQETIAVLFAVPSTVLVFSFLPDNDDGIDPRRLFSHLNIVSVASDSESDTRPSILPNLEILYYRISDKDKVPESQLFWKLRCPKAQTKRPMWMLKIIHQRDEIEDGPLKIYPGMTPSLRAVSKLVELEEKHFDLHLTPDVNDYIDYMLEDVD